MSSSPSSKPASFKMRFTSLWSLGPHVLAHLGWLSRTPGRSEYIQSVSIIHACIIVCQCMLGILISILFHKCIHAYMIFSNHDFSISSFWFGSIVFFVSLNSFPQTWNIAASIFIMNLKSWWSSSSAPLSSSTPPSSSSSSSPDCCLDAPTLHHGLSMHMCCHHLLPFVPCATHQNIPQLTNIDNGVFNRGFDINLWFFRKMWVSKPAKDIPSQKEDLRADAREHEYWPKMAATIRRSRFILFQYPPKKKSTKQILSHTVLLKILRMNDSWILLYIGYYPFGSSSVKQWFVISCMQPDSLLLYFFNNLIAAMLRNAISLQPRLSSMLHLQQAFSLMQLQAFSVMTSLFLCPSQPLCFLLWPSVSSLCFFPWPSRPLCFSLSPSVSSLCFLLWDPPLRCPAPAFTVAQWFFLDKSVQ